MLKITYIKKNFNHLIFVILIASFFLTNIIKLPYFGSKIQMTEIIFFIFSPLLPIKKIYQLQKNENKIFFYFIFLFLFFEFVSSLVSRNVLSFINTIGRLYLVIFFSFIYYYFKTFLFISINYKSKIKKIISIILFFIFIQTIIGAIFISLGIESKIFSLYTNYPYFGSIYRLQGFTNGPNLFANILIIFTLLFLGLEELSEKNKILNIFYVVLCLFCLALTFSKSIITFAFGITIIIFINSSKRLKQYILLLTLFYTIFYFISSHIIVATNTSNIQESLKTTNFTSDKVLYKNEKIVIIETGYLLLKKIELDVIKKNIFLGVGTANFIYEINFYRKNGYYPDKLPNFDPHCTYLGVFVENGIFAFVIFIFILIYIFRKFVQNLDDRLTLFLFIIYIIFLIEAITTDILNYRHFWFFLSFALSYLNFQNKVKHESK